MVVKSKIGRKRYIIIKIDSNSIISKSDLIFTLNKFTTNTSNNSNIKSYMKSEEMITIPSVNSNKRMKTQSNLVKGIQTPNRKDKPLSRFPWVIGISNNYGIIRCHHLDKNKTIKLLESIKWAGREKNQVKIITLGTTGTIRSARKKYLDKLTLYP